MGMSPFFSSCSCVSETVDNVKVITKIVKDRSGNPDPSRFNIDEAHLDVNGFTIMRVTYHGCKNYEGNKILVYKDLSKEQLTRMVIRRELDPHFCEKGKHPSPVARFVPTEEGWEMAHTFCLNYKR